MAETNALSRLSLAQRLLIGAGIWSLIVLIGGAFALSGIYRTQTLRLLEEDLDAQVIALTRAVDYDGRTGIGADESLLPSDVRYSTPYSGRYFAILDVTPAGPVGEEDLRSRSLWDGEAPLPQALREAALAGPGTTRFANAAGPEGEPLRVAARVIQFDQSGGKVLLLAAADRRASDEGAQRFLILLIGAMIALAGGVLIAMWAQIRLVLRPLERVEAHVADVREGRRQHLDTDYPPELQPLTEELNKLIDHNRDVVERARTHVGNLAHALKTPLAVLRNEASGDSALDQLVRRQTEAMHANVDHYLKRAQAAARAQSLGARTEVGPVVEGLVRLLNRLFQDKGLYVTSELSGEPVFRGEKQDLEEMLGNLMDNACKWARTRVTVRVDGAAAGPLIIHVDDDGRGLSTQDRETALKRGVRLDETAPGTGLGLSIVTELAELYSGQLTLSESPAGGLRASLELPSA